MRPSGIRPAVLATAMILAAMRAAEGGVVLEFDYRFDTHSFFAGESAARAALEAAGSFYESILDDDLRALVPRSLNTWKIELTNPATGEEEVISNPTVAADTLLIFVGARELEDNILGRAGPGGWSSRGSTSWNNVIGHRGEGVTTGTGAKDFATWGGSLTVDLDGSWNLDHTLAPRSGQLDLYSVLLHELGHVLGIGIADSWENLIDPANRFTGPASVAQFGDLVPLADGGSHFDANTHSDVYSGGTAQDASFDPFIRTGRRELPTDLDVAALDDVGWDINPIENFTNPAGGHFETGGNWSSGAKPAPRDVAHFGLSAAYRVTFAADQSTRQASVENGEVTFDLGSSGYTIDYLMMPAADATLRVSGGTLRIKQEVFAAAGANLTIENGGTLWIGGGVTVDQGVRLDGGTLTGTGTVVGNLALDAGDSIAPAGSGGKLTVKGDLRMDAGSKYVCKIDAETGDLLAVTGDVRLGAGSELILEVTGAAARGDSTREIVTAAGRNGVVGRFAKVPPLHDDLLKNPAKGHLGLGVFHRGVNYVPLGPKTTRVTVDLFTAAGGDGNGDGFVDGADISNLVFYFNSATDPPDRDWTKNDTAGGPTGRGDGYVDGADLSDMVENFTGDPGPAKEAAAMARYDPASGEFTVSVGNVMSWTLQSDGRFTGRELGGVFDILPRGSELNLISGNPNTVGEGGFGPVMTYADVSLGRIAEPGTPVEEFSLRYVTGFGQPAMEGSITVIPEPGTLAMLAAALLPLLWFRRRNRKRGHVR